MKIAVVTGASSGMGREFVRQLPGVCPELQEIWVIARRKERLEELKKQTKVPLRLISADLTKTEEIQKIRTMFETIHPQISVLVNAAGMGVYKKIEDSSLDACAAMTDLNCKALTQMTQAALPYLTKGSHIFMLASASAFLPQPGFAVYAASKAYVLSFSRALARELKGKTVVTIVCPGPVDTEFLDTIGGKKGIPTYKQKFIADPRKVVRKALKDGIRKKELSVYSISMKSFHMVCKIIPHRVILNFVK